jgi:HSP20 family protein
MSSLFNEVFGIDRVLDEMQSHPLAAAASNSGYPYINVAELKDEIQIVAEVPGVPKESIKLQFHDGVLTISCERKAPKSEKATWLRNEIVYGSFSRSIELPDRVNADNVNAEYSNGVLRITLPKSEEAKPREISIR